MAKSAAWVFRLSRPPQNVGFAREHCGPRQRARLWLTIQNPADEIGRQPGEMDQVTDIVVGNIFTKRNFRHRLRSAGRELFEPDRCARDRLYDNGIRCFGVLTLENKFAGSAT